MEQSFEQAGKLGKELADTSLQSISAMANGMQSIASEAADFSRKSFETRFQGHGADDRGQVAREGNGDSGGPRPRAPMKDLLPRRPA